MRSRQSDTDGSKVLTTDTALLPATWVANPKLHKPYGPRGCRITPKHSSSPPAPHGGAVKSYDCFCQGCSLAQRRAGETVTGKRSCWPDVLVKVVFASSPAQLLHQQPPVDPTSHLRSVIRPELDSSTALLLTSEAHSDSRLKTQPLKLSS